LEDKNGQWLLQDPGNPSNIRETSVLGLDDKPCLLTLFESAEILGENMLMRRAKVRRDSVDPTRQSAAGGRVAFHACAPAFY
jgi:hypothetical protein